MKRLQSSQWLLSAIFCMLLLAACGGQSAPTGATGNGDTSNVVPSPTPHTTSKTPTAKKPTATPVNIAMKPKPTTAPIVVPTVAPTTAPGVVPTPVPPTAAPIVPAQPPVSGGNSVQSAAQAVFALINQERASKGLAPYIWSAQLVQSAHKHNLTMAAANQLSHQLPGEAYFGDRERQAGVNWVAAAENIGVGYGDPTNASVGLNQAMFGEQPPDDGHRRNILSTGCTMVGVDVLVDTAHSRIWLTEDFAGI
ncbi:CAP domain-containing protein [Dictyobacter vulcani]|nr:CAP domain-containing protein [Dictyobacter vulcani]